MKDNKSYIVELCDKTWKIIVTINEHLVQLYKEPLDNIKDIEYYESQCRYYMKIYDTLTTIRNNKLLYFLIIHSLR